MIDLQPFCAIDDPSGTREFILRPFRHGDFTYATDGHVMVRVAPVETAPPLPDDVAHWDVQRPLDLYHDGRTFAPAPAGALDRLPAFEKIPCRECGLSGGVDPICESCGGVGFDYRMISAALGGALFYARYLRLVLELPGVELALPVLPRSTTDFQALAFRFDGGIGALCSLRSPYAEHIGDIATSEGRPCAN